MYSVKLVQRKIWADFEDMSESEQQQQQQQTTTSARRIRINHQLTDITSSTPTDHQTRKRHGSEQESWQSNLVFLLFFVLR